MVYLYRVLLTYDYLPADTYMAACPSDSANSRLLKQTRLIEEKNDRITGLDCQISLAKVVSFMDGYSSLGFITVLSSRL